MITQHKRANRWFQFTTDRRKVLVLLRYFSIVSYYRFSKNRIRNNLTYTRNQTILQTQTTCYLCQPPFSGKESIILSLLFVFIKKKMNLRLPNCYCLYKIQLVQDILVYRLPLRCVSFRSRRILLDGSLAWSSLGGPAKLLEYQTGPLA